MSGAAAFALESLENEVGAVVPRWLACRSEIGQTPKLVYGRMVALALAADSSGSKEFFTTQRDLASFYGVTVRAMVDVLASLRQWDLIETSVTEDRRGMQVRLNQTHPWRREWEKRAKGK
jgi:DNA-binding MarR family transcriptional regulator